MLMTSLARDADALGSIKVEGIPGMFAGQGLTTE